MNTVFSRKHGLAMAIIGFVGSVFGIGSPTDLTIAPIDYTQSACNLDCSAKLSWTAPAVGTPTGYKVYRRIAAHERPTLAGTVGSETTSFTDSAATIGQLYSYTVSAVDAEGESEESAAVAYRRLENVALASKGNTTLNSPILGNGVVANANDGVINNVVLNGNSNAHLLTLSFKEGRRPRLELIRMNFGSWGGNDNVAQYFYGTVLRNGTDVKTEFDGNTASFPTHRFTKDAWNRFPVADSLHGDVWTSLTFGGGNWYGNCRELEAYGYLPNSADLLGAPTFAEPSLGDGEALLSWTGAANAVAYAVYRKTDEGTWVCLADNLKSRLFKDTGLTAGKDYIYRVAAVAANGDESSLAEGLTLTAQGAVTDIPAAYGVIAADIDFTQAACNVDCSAKLAWSLVNAACYDKVRVYRYMKGHEDETPEPVATLDKATATYTDTTANVGQAYLYKVACFDSATGKEGPLSQACEYRRVKRISGADCGKWTATESGVDSANNFTIEGVYDGTLTKGTRSGGWSTYVDTFSSDAVISAVRVYRPANYWYTDQGSYWVRAKPASGGVEVYFTKSASEQSNPNITTKGSSAWEVYATHPDYAGVLFTAAEIRAVSAFYSFYNEIEYYGYLTGGTVLAAPELGNPVAGKKVVTLTWTAAANAATYAVYRKAPEGDWVTVARGLTALTATDAGATFDGTTYTYRVAAVAANGDELSSEQKTVVCPVGAPFWWNFLNVKSVAFPGAAAYANPSQVKPHFMSRDKAGTLLAVPMGTDNGAHPAVTFDFAALASPDNLGELSIAQSGLKKYGMESDFGGGLGCWKGAAVSADLVVIGNGAADSKVAVIERATGACAKYWLLDASGLVETYALDGGLDFDAAGTSLYSNDGAAQNKIVKWQVDAAAKALKRVADYTATGFTRIRNLSICTVGGEEYALFGEGAAKTGKVGAMKLSDGSFVTLVTDIANLGGDIVNVKLAEADDETFVVVQLDTAEVAVYRLDAATMTATLEKAIDAATMKSLYGTASDQYRNFEMTADGRYAFVMNNAGAMTRLTVIGSNEPLFADTAPVPEVTANFANKFIPTLTWTEGEDVLAESVRVFRAQVGKPGAVALADVPIGTQTYVDDSAVAGVPYAYSVAYVHTVNGKKLVGVRSEEVEAMALMDLKTKRKAVLTNNADASSTVNNLFDDNTSTLHSNSQWEERAAMQFTERVLLMAVRYWPKNWGTIHRGDNLKVNGNVEKSSSWTDGLTLVGTGPVVEEETWYDVTLNGSAAPEAGWDYLVLVPGCPKGADNRGPYLNLCEVDFYGALVGARSVAMEKDSEICRDDAPAVVESTAHALSWTESGNLTGVAVLRARTSEGPFVEIARIAPDVGAFKDDTAVDGVVYYYQLAYLNEFEGVVYVGVPSATFADYGARTDVSGAYRSAIIQEWTANWSGGYAFDDNVSTTVNGPTGGSDRFGLAFSTPVVVNAIALRGPDWAVNANGYRIDNLGIYAAPAGISGIAATSQTGYLQITSEAVDQFTQIGTTPSGCRVGQKWYVTPTTGEKVWSYLYCTKHNWFASISGMRTYGYPKAVVDAAKARVVWPVEDFAAAMSDGTAVLSWKNVNALAESIRVERRVNGGEWTELATLEPDATAYSDSAAEIGKHNEYRVWTVDATERVYRSATMTPLLAHGDRVVVKSCGSAADPLFVDAFAMPADQWFKATLVLPGTDAAAMGFSGDVRIVAAETDPVDGVGVQVIRNVSTGALSLVVKGPGYENGQTFAAAQAVPDCDGLCLVRDRLAVKASYHTAAGGWVQFASADFTSSPFADRLFVGVGAHETDVTEAKPTAFRVGKLRLRLSPGMTVILR